MPRREKVHECERDGGRMPLPRHGSFDGRPVGKCIQRENTRSTVVGDFGACLRKKSRSRRNQPANRRIPCFSIRHLSRAVDYSRAGNSRRSQVPVVGYGFGKTPMQTFIDGIAVAKKYRLQNQELIKPNEPLLSHSVVKIRKVV